MIHIADSVQCVKAINHENNCLPYMCFVLLPAVGIGGCRTVAAFFLKIKPCGEKSTAGTLYCYKELSHLWQGSPSLPLINSYQDRDNTVCFQCLGFTDHIFHHALTDNCIWVFKAVVLTKISSPKKFIYKLIWS